MATRRTKDQIIADLQSKIDYHQGHIDRLNREIEAQRNPTPRTTMKQVAEAIKELGLTPDEVIALVKKAKPKAKNG